MNAQTAVDRNAGEFLDRSHLFASSFFFVSSREKA
jgi:hypothetical protein